MARPALILLVQHLHQIPHLLLQFIRAGYRLRHLCADQLPVTLPQPVHQHWHGGIRQIGRPVPRFSICVDGHEHQASFALITRVRNYGGDFQIARRIKLTDADFEIVVFENHEWHDYLRFFGAVVTNRLYETEGVFVYRSTKATLNAPDAGPIYVQADGEAVGNLPATITTVPDALTLLIPKRYAEM